MTLAFCVCTALFVSDMVKNPEERISHAAAHFLQCKAGLATFQMLEALKTPPTKIMLLGCGCSTAAEATAQVSYLYNLTQVRYSSMSTSDGSKIGRFFPS